ncbi:MAG: hypothetical protein ACK5C5_07335 [Bacteroidota bacterium]|jgi:hypothetical protein
MDHKDNNYHFTISEIQILRDLDFFIQKKRLLKLICEQMDRYGHDISDAFSQIEDAFPYELRKPTSKISKGEYYMDAPWVVLDKPSVFSKDGIFAFRHIFLWGRGFSSTLHISGKYLGMIDLEALLKMNDQSILILKGDNPFIHHYDEKLYVKLTEINTEKIMNQGYIRVSIFSDLDMIDKIPENGLKLMQLAKSFIRLRSQ